MLSIVCGLGQLYNGQGIKGFLLLLGGAASVAAIVMWQSTAALVVATVLWLYAIVDAYLVARQT
jgi:TM2 domain-containing membrane protein YozV